MGENSPLSPPLTQACAGSREAIDAVVEANLGLVHAIARRFFGRGSDPEDLLQVGMIGLFKAARDFDPSYGTAFSTYAVPKIEGEIRRFLRSDGMIRVSRTVYERAGLIRRTEASLCARLGRPPRLSEISRELGLTAEEIAETDSAFTGVDSLEREISEDGLTLGALLSDQREQEHDTDALILRDAVSRLEKTERSVIDCLFYRGLTQVQTASLLGISQVQVSRLRRRALESLRQALTET